MRRPSTAPIAPLTALALAIALAAAAPAHAGGKAPDFTLPDLDGRNVSLSDFSGKVVVLSFWAHWCNPCKAEMPYLEAMYKELADQGLMILSISVDEARNEPQVKQIIRSGQYTFPVLLDKNTEVVTLFNPRKSVPYTVVIGKDGAVHSKHEGYAPGDEVKLKVEVEALLGIGDPPSASGGSAGSGG